MTYAALALYALCSAAQDALWHGHDASVFRAAGRTGYWGDARTVYLRRYVGHDPANGLRWPFRVPLLREAAAAVWDGWHLCKTARYVTVAALAARVLALPWWGAPALYLALAAVFLVGYRALRRRPLL